MGVVEAGDEDFELRVLGGEGRVVAGMNVQLRRTGGLRLSFMKRGSMLETNSELDGVDAGRGIGGSVEYRR